MLSVLSAKSSGLGLQACIKDDKGPCTRWLSGGCHTLSGERGLRGHNHSVLMRFGSKELTF